MPNPTVTSTQPSPGNARQARDRHPIPRRTMKFAFDTVDDRFWFGGNGVLSALISGLSATFPPGEKEFVRSVVHFRDQITDPTLLEQIRGFAAQEGHHAHQHRLANAWLDSKGFGASQVEKMVEENIAQILSAPGDHSAEHLASTVLFEHITATLAEFLLTRPDVMEKMAEPVRELLMWHAVEEIEHKAVAFDVYMATVGDRGLLKRMGVVLTLFFLYRQVLHTTTALRSLGHRPSAREIVGALDFLIGPTGLFASVGKEYLRFYGNDFHPWNHDNRHLIEDWKARHGGVQAA